MCLFGLMKFFIVVCSVSLCWCFRLLFVWVSFCLLVQVFDRGFKSFDFVDV